MTLKLHAHLGIAGQMDILATWLLTAPDFAIVNDMQHTCDTPGYFPLALDSHPTQPSIASVHDDRFPRLR